MRRRLRARRFPLTQDFAWAAALALVVALAAGACASRPSGGFEHEVRSGENLYRIGRRYGVSAEVLREANRIGDVRSLRVGQKLWIPPAGTGSAGPLGVALTPDDLAFRWPLVGGRLTSSYGRRGGSAHEGIDIAAPRGTAVHAAEAGKVVFAGWMNDYGRLVVLKHAGRYRSVYAHLQRIDVEEGRFIERGEAVGLVGTSGNASGPHLHFEIREQDRARDPIRYLP